MVLPSDDEIRWVRSNASYYDIPGEIEISPLKTKRYSYVYEEKAKRGDKMIQKKVNFGSKNKDTLYQLDRNDNLSSNEKYNLRKKHKSSLKNKLTKDGKPAYKVRYTPEWLDYHLLW